MSTTSPETHLQLAQANTDPGFKVPGAADKPEAAAGAAPALEMTAPPAPPATDTSARELAIGGGVFIVLLVVFFLARNAFSTHLVRRRVAPSAAESAGWLLFFGLSFASAAVVLALINASKFFNLAVTGTLMLLGLAALIGALLAGRR